MNNILAFTERNIKEMLRDPLSYIFCLGFPLVMLLVMTLVDRSIPSEAGMTVFRIDNLSPGIAVFGQTFVMLFTAMNVSKDRSTSFMTRMYATPMVSSDFALGYILPMFIISIIQTVITYAASFIISLVTDVQLSIAGMLFSTVVLIPSALMFIGLGLLFGTLFNDKAAPGMCSIEISLSSFLGCIWFDADSTGGIMLKICKSLPFYYCTRSARASLALNFSYDNLVLPLFIVAACTVVITLVAILIFSRKMKSDMS